jgi:hypothetical protein
MPMQTPAIPEGVKAAVDYFVSIGLTSAVVGSVVSWLTHLLLTEKIKSKIKSEYDEKLETLKAQLKGQYDEKLETHKAQLKAQADVEIEKLKSELNITAAQSQFRFSKLHEKRAEIIAEVYASLREALTCLSEYTKAFEPDGGASREDRRKNAANAANSFAKLYAAKQIFIPEAAAAKLDEINQELKSAFIQFAYGVDMMPNENLDHTSNWVKVAGKVEKLSKTALRELERDFRSLLGDDGSISNS